jgi:hypothetical protein
MKKYRISITLDCLYEFYAPSQEAAIDRAVEWFNECEPEMTVEVIVDENGEVKK